jgi:hypothetical protein
LFGGSIVGSGSLALKNTTGVTQFSAGSTGVTVSDSSGVSKFNVAASTGNVTVGGTLTVTSGFSGSLTKLASGGDYLIAGNNIILTTGSSGAITISSAATGGAGDPGATYLVLSATGSLTSERVITAGTGITATDGGAGANYTLAINDGVVATISGATFTGGVTFNNNVGIGTTATSVKFAVSGSSSAGVPTAVIREGIASQSDVTAVLDVQNSAGTSLFFVTGSGAVGISTNNTLGSKLYVSSSLTGNAASALIVGGQVLGVSLNTYKAQTHLFQLASSTEAMRIDSNGNVGIGTNSTNGNKLAVNGDMSITGSTLPGITNTHTLGSTTKLWSNVYSTAFSGSLTKLSTGADYLVAGTGISLSTGSTGNITISSTAGGVAGTDTQIQFNDGGAFGGDGGLTYNKVTDTLTGVTASFYRITTTDTASFNGNVTLGDASADTVTVNGTATFVGAAVTTTFAGDVAVNGGDVTTTATTFNLVNGTATTVNFAGAGTDVNIGTTSGNLYLKNATTNVSGNIVSAGDIAVNGGDVTTSATTFNLVNGTATTVNFAGAGTDVNVGAVTGNLYLKNATTNVSGNIVSAGDVAVNGGDITSSAATFNLLNGTVTTLNLAGAGTDINVGSNGAGSLYLKNATVYISGSSVHAGASSFNGNVTFGDATSDTITFTARSATSFLPSADVTYDLGSASLRWANIYTGDLHLKNERGDYTLIEEPDFLTIRFNKTGKRYKFMLEAVPEFDEEIGNFSSGPTPDKK